METVGSVAELWRFPVKSMKGEQLREVTITERGVLGDRAYALIDTATGKVASAKSVKLFPDLLACRAAFVEAPRAKREVPPVRIDLPNGRSVTSDSRDVDGALSAYFRRDVTLARVAPDDFTIDQYHPDVEGADLGATETRLSHRSSERLCSPRLERNPRSRPALSSMCFRFRS